MSTKQKPVLLVPMMGVAQRFLDRGYTIPKPLIMVEDEHIIDMSMSSLELSEYSRIIFVVRQEHVYNFSIDEVLKQKFACEVLVLDQDTGGSLETCIVCLEKKRLRDCNAPLVIYTPDVYFYPKFSVEDIGDLEGLILSFQANSPNHSYIQTNDEGVVTKVAEKQVISNKACVGIYYVNSTSAFYLSAIQMINNKEMTNNEFYIAPLFNYFITRGMKIGYKTVEQMHVLGTPSELEFFKKHSCRHLADKTSKPIALSCDHSGYELKESVKQWFVNEGIDFIDFGTYTNKSCDYADYIQQATEAVSSGRCYIGFGFCRTGQGANICANKQDGIFSALVFDEYTAKYSVAHNCANFFSIPSKYVDIGNFLGMFHHIAYDATFDSGRHMTRIMKFQA